MDGRVRFTPQKRGRFISELRLTGNVTQAAHVIGMTRRRMYMLREQDAAFAEEWATAFEDYIARMEAEADRRAVDGFVKQVYFDEQGKPQEVKGYSDNLLMFRLKGLKPEMYRETTYRPEGLSPQVLQLIIQKILVYLPDEQAHELLDFVAAQLPATSTQRVAAPTGLAGSSTNGH